jgi:hypothetical protein
MKALGNDGRANKPPAKGECHYLDITDIGGRKRGMAMQSLKNRTLAISKDVIFLERLSISSRFFRLKHH